MIFAPHGQGNQKVAHLKLAAATLGSSSTASTAGTGYRFIPVYCLISASGAASFALTNGTGGSVIMTGFTQAGGVFPWSFWDEPGNLLANKTLNLETNAGIGTHEFHVWYVVKRGGAGQNALNS